MCLYRPILLLVCALWPVVAVGQPTAIEIERIADQMVRLCVGGGTRFQVSGGGTAGAEVSLWSFDVEGNLQAELKVERSKVEGLVGGIDSSLTEVAADQASQVRACLQPLRERLLDIMLPISPTIDPCPIMKEVQQNLDDTYTAFNAQARRRNDLVEEMRNRLGIRERLEYEKFFFRYYHQMNADERFQFAMIRAITEGPIYEGNKETLELLDSAPFLYDEIPILADLRQHLVFWINKYERVFVPTEAMALLYAGVEDGVPFPSGVDRAVDDWLERCDEAQAE